MNYKKILTGMAAVVAVAFGFTACSENVEVNNNANNNETLSIGVSVHQGWNDDEKTRSARRLARINEKQAAGVEKVITTEGSLEGEPIYMWCDELDGIDGKGHSVVVDETYAEETTRGTLMDGHDNNTGDGIENFDKQSFYNNFNIFGTDAPESGALATWKHDNEWSVSGSVTWGSNTFYGVAPANNEGVSGTSQTGFTFTTQTDSKNQIDLMVGPSTKVNDRHILFKFQHVLSAIKFKLGNKFASGYQITKLELMNINSKNTYNFSTGWGTPNTPFTTSVATEFSTTGGANKMITNDGEANKTVGTTFLVLPQTLPDDAYAIVTLVKEGESPKYLNAQLKTMTPTWLPGHTYTYVISSSDYPSSYTFDVTQNPEFTWNGDPISANSDLFTVKSYYTDGGINTEKGWKVIGYKVSKPGGDFPSDAQWQADMPRVLNSVQGTGTGSVTGETKQVAVYRQSPTQTQRQQNELRDPNRELKENLDLSLYKVDNDTPWPGNVRNTANTYIVRYGGTYKFPLVMGNTIKNSAKYVPEDYSCADGSGWFKVSKNKKATEGTYKNKIVFDKETKGNFYFGKQTFVDYKNDLVTASNYQVDATSAFVLWHDFSDTEREDELTVIKDVSITTEGADGLVSKFVTFTVDENTIQQGNAVIAVKNGAGKITWSWQIYITYDNWISDEGQTEVTNKAGNKFTLANYNLGYVSKNNRGTYDFPVRKIKLLIEQDESGQLAEVVITQNEGSQYKSQNYDWDTKYQWGRKDALPGTGIAGQNEAGADFSPSPYYDFGCRFFTASGYAYEPKAKKISENWTYGESIQYPLKRLNNSGSGNEEHPNGCWSNRMYINAWSAAKNTLQTAGSATGYGHDPDGSDNFIIGSVDDEDEHEHKTLYDPCPPGFKMPPSGVFTNFALEGYSANAEGSFDNPGEPNTTGKGFAFYAAGTSGKTIYFPATGRLKDSGLESWNKRSWVWSATPSAVHDNYYGEGNSLNQNTGVHGACSVHLSYTSTRTTPLNNNTQNMPHSVRPMVDND